MPKASTWPKRPETIGSKVPTATSGPSLGRGRRHPHRLPAIVGTSHAGGAVGGDPLADPVQGPVGRDLAVEATGPEVRDQLVHVAGVEVGEVPVVDLEAGGFGAGRLALHVL